MYAMVGMVLGDSFIVTWDLKYEINLLRPETYINAHISRRWRPFINTPPFPEYPSGHSVVSGAAGDMLTALFGTVHFVDTLHAQDGETPREFFSFEQAANEAAISRLYGGIHYRSAIENGLRMGECIASTALNNVVMRPLSQGE
jgi:membrane-associated phospholipid phosphatase